MAVTAPPLASVVKAIGGENVEVKSIIPAGADPHHYEPSEPELLDALTDADLIVMTGPSHLIIEKRIRELVERGVLKAGLLDYRAYEEEGFKLMVNPLTEAPNPHGYLFSLSGLEAAAKAVEERLSEINPEKKDYYGERLSGYLAQLGSLEKTIERLDLKSVRVVLLTPVLQYVARDIGVRVVEIILPELDIEPSESDITRLLTLLDENRADLVLLSDLEAGRHPKLLSILRDRGMAYLIVPTLSLLDAPQTISVTVASALRCYTMTKLNPRSSEMNIVTTSSLAANIILFILVILLLRKVRRYGE